MLQHMGVLRERKRIQAQKRCLIGIGAVNLNIGVASQRLLILSLRGFNYKEIGICVSFQAQPIQQGINCIGFARASRAGNEHMCSETIPVQAYRSLFLLPHVVDPSKRNDRLFRVPCILDHFPAKGDALIYRQTAD